jgi:hypothetical protein
MASYLAFILGCMGTWTFVYAHLNERQVDVHVLGMITQFGAIVFFFARSIAILVLHGLHVESDNA